MTADFWTWPDNMSTVAPQLYSEDLIPKAIYENNITSSKTGRDKANLLLLALDAQPQLMKTLIKILRKSDALKVIADKMNLEL